MAATASQQADAWHVCSPQRRYYSLGGTVALDGGYKRTHKQRSEKRKCLIKHAADSRGILQRTDNGRT
jgi:hypothetical protein